MIPRVLAQFEQNRAIPEIMLLPINHPTDCHSDMWHIGWHPTLAAGSQLALSQSQDPTSSTCGLDDLRPIMGGGWRRKRVSNQQPFEPTEAVTIPPPQGSLRNGVIVISPERVPGRTFACSLTLTLTVIFVSSALHKHFQNKVLQGDGDDSVICYALVIFEIRDRNTLLKLSDGVEEEKRRGEKEIRSVCSFFEEALDTVEPQTLNQCFEGATGKRLATQKRCYREEYKKETLKPCVQNAHMVKMTLGPEGIQPEVRMGITE